MDRNSWSFEMNAVFELNNTRPLVELDQCITIEVMGWTIQPNDWFYSRNLDEHELRTTLSYSECSRYWPSHIRRRELLRGAMMPWSPSTNILHAFEVVAEMQRRGWRVTIYEEPKRISVQFGRVDNACWSRGGEGKTFAEAICNAALAAVRSVPVRA